MKTLIRYILLALSVCLIAPANGLAQTVDEIRVPPLPLPLDYGEWSSDSQWFTFVNYTDLIPATNIPDSSLSVELESPSWIAYNPETHRYVSDTTWWLQPSLSAAEQAAFATHDLIRSSPDGELLLFSKLDENGRFQYHLANRTTQEIISLNIDSNEFNFHSFYPIRWSEDGNQLALSTIVSEYSGAPAIWYIDIFDRNNLQNTEVILFEDRLPVGHDFMTIDSFIDRLFDISADGTQVVLSTKDLSDLTLDQLPHFVIVWQPDAPEDSLIIEDYAPSDIASIAFVPHDETQLLVLLKSGELYLYDLETRYQQQLAALEPSDFTFFSPDGRWLAYANQQIDFIEIDPLLEQANQFPISDAGPDQTITDSDDSGSEATTLDGSSSNDSDGTIDIVRRNITPAFGAMGKSR